MTTVQKRRPLPVDPEAEAFEQRRREELNGNDAYKRGMAHAVAQERMNAQGALNGALADLKRVTLTRDTTQAGRDAYDRTWNRTLKAAERVASMDEGAIGADGKVIQGAVTIPAYLPAPQPTVAQTIVVGAPRSNPCYHETT